MKKFIQYIVAALMTISPFYAFADGEIEATDNSAGAELKTESEYQKLIDSYKQHLTMVPKHIREEIQVFRIEIAKIQKQKRALYKSLSIEAQEYLKLEEKFRQQLPVNDGKIDLNKQTNISSDQTNR